MALYEQHYITPVKRDRPKTSCIPRRFSVISARAKDQILSDRQELQVGHVRDFGGSSTGLVCAVGYGSCQGLLQDC